MHVLLDNEGCHAPIVVEPELEVHIRHVQLDSFLQHIKDLLVLASIQKLGPALQSNKQST